jgi:D-inositol-3-phosphate glycosyltransferase
MRKRIDLDLYYFSEWRKDKPKTVKFHYHGAIQDEGWHILDLAKAFGIEKDQLIITAPNITASQGLPLELMPYVFAPADVGLTSTMAEGFGLTIIERMAMQIAMIVPRHSALAEWPIQNGVEGVHYTEISNIPYFATNGLNTQQSVPTFESTLAALDKMYYDIGYRNRVAEAGYKIATSDTFKWHKIAARFKDVFIRTIKEHKDIIDNGNESNTRSDNVTANDTSSEG